MFVDLQIIRLLLKILASLSWKDMDHIIKDPSNTDVLQRWYFETRNKS